MFDRPSAIAPRLKAPLVLAAAVFAAWFAMQALGWRSGAYWRVAEPNSNTGAVTHALAVLDAARVPGRRTVLVLGDSRIGEGFSGPRAGAGGDIDFINVSVPGSTARTWYYLLREIDRRGVHYDAVLLGAMYRSTDQRPTRDWALDAPHQVALVGLRDLPRYAWEAGAGEPRRRAWQALLLPELVAQQDARGLLAAPAARWHDLRVRTQYMNDTINYPGRDGRIADEYDADAVRASPIPPGLARDNADYLSHWMGRIAARAAARGARTIAFQIPRGPYREVLLPYGTPAWNGVELLPADLFADLESPAYFFDLLHLNRAGRERMSDRLGERVRGLLGEPR